MSQIIYIKDVKRRIDLMPQQGDETFVLEYRKKDGTYGKKSKCRLRSGRVKEKNDLLSIKQENRRAGKLYLEYMRPDGTWQKFEVFLCLCVKYNGLIIDHRF